MKEGGGYTYPHNDPTGFVAQSYRPAELETTEDGRRRLYYRPSPDGAEADIAQRLRDWGGDEAYDDEAWFRFQKFRDPSR